MTAADWGLALVATLSVVASAFASAAALAYLLNRRVWPLVGTLPLALAPLTSILASAAELLVAAGRLPHVVPHNQGGLWLHAPMLANALPSLLLLTGCALAGSLRGPRGWKRPALALTLALPTMVGAAALAAPLGLSALWFPAATAVAVLLAALATVSDDREGAAPHAAMAAALTVPVLVGCGAASLLAGGAPLPVAIAVWAWSALCATVPLAPPAHKRTNWALASWPGLVGGLAAGALLAIGGGSQL